MNRPRPFYWRSLADISVFLLILVAINLAWFRHVPAFRGEPVHPYLLPVALIGLFYGFREAIAAAILSVAVYGAQLSFAGFPATSLWVRPDLTNVVAFLAAGVFFGEAGELYQRALHHHREKSMSLETQLAAVSEERNRLEASNRELEEWIRFGDVQLTEIHAAADDLFSFDEARILDVATPLALKIVGADQGSLYLFDRGRDRFWRRSTAGEGPISNPPAVSQDVAPFSRLRQSPSVLSVRDVTVFDAGIQFMAAAPIVARGAVVGALLIESMPLARLTPYTLANLGFLSDLLNRCLDQASRRKETVRAGLEDWDRFTERIDQEVHAANRYDEELSLLYLDIHDFETVASELGPETSDSLISQILGVVERSKRRSDVLAYQGNGRMALLMPQTAPSKTDAFITRTRERIDTIAVPSERKGRFEVTFSLGTQTLVDSGLRRAGPPAPPTSER